MQHPSLNDPATRAKNLTNRARAHGVSLVPGEPVLDVIEKLVDRLDKYRDVPQNKGSILVE